MTLKLGNGANVAAKAIRSTSIDLYNHILLLKDVLHVPNAHKNIVSISSLTRKGYEILFCRDICKIHLEMNWLAWVI